MITNTKLLDRVSTETLLKQTNMMSVNQINGQIKIQKIWKSRNIPNYSIQVAAELINEIGTTTRAGTSGRLIQSGKSCLAQKGLITEMLSCQVL